MYWEQFESGTICVGIIFILGTNCFGAFVPRTIYVGNKHFLNVIKKSLKKTTMFMKILQMLF
jgi:hypothetical protein